MSEEEDKKEKSKPTVLYDPAEFRVAASDTKGHSERCQFRAQPGHVNQVTAILASRLFPFRTKGDLYRFALKRALRYLGDLEPIPSVTKEVDAILEIMRTEEFRKDLANVIERLATNVSDLIGRNAEPEARRLILKIKRHISMMPDGFWRDRYVTEINDRFGYLLDKVERASLLRLAADDE